MSTMLPIRQLNRSAKVGIGSKDAAAGRTVLVNIDNQRVARDLARHSAIGQLFQVGSAFWQDDAGVVEAGGVVTVNGFVASATAVSGRSLAGTAFSGAVPSNVTLSAPVATNGRVDLVSVTLAAPGTLVKTDGTAGTPFSGANAVALGGRPTVPASSVALAYVVWPPNSGSATVTVATDIITLSNHGYTDGQKLTLATIATATGATAGDVVYVINPTTNTFQVSTTKGGAAINFGGTDGTATFNVGPTVIDARP